MTIKPAAAVMTVAVIARLTALLNEASDAVSPSRFPVNNGATQHHNTLMIT